MPPVEVGLGAGVDGGQSDPPSESSATVHDDVLEGNPYDLDDAERYADRVAELEAEQSQWYFEQESMDAELPFLW
jgi:hypothetical protein